MNIIRYSTQDIDESDINSVINLLSSDFLTQGPVGVEFENSLAKICNANHSISVSSATAGLHIAYKALGLNEGDIVWTTPITFVATANAALYCGALIDYVDINPTTFNMCVDALAEKLEKAEVAGKLPKILVPVHLGGLSCDMRQIKKLSEKYGFNIVEDASHALGGEYEDQAIGKCVNSDLCIFSFHPVKMITTGEGGAILTQNEELAKKCKLLRSHGITRNIEEMQTKKIIAPWYYEQIELGFNYRMSDIQAALGITQLKKLNTFVNKRRSLANNYDQNLNLDFYKPQAKLKNALSSYHLYIIKIKDPNLRDSLFYHLKKNSIMANLHYIPLYRQPYLKKINPTDISLFPNSEMYYSSALSIPLHTKMSLDDQQHVIKVIDEFTKQC